jgi:hypothetical protein
MRFGVHHRRADEDGLANPVKNADAVERGNERINSGKMIGGKITRLAFDLPRTKAPLVGIRLMTDFPGVAEPQLKL